ncbi:MAG: hypothetical protein HY537_10115 [Deltaproteobacteria bacterium]|nr:hypothetical protein [Deltaproteobacteria bacterium]
MNASNNPKIKKTMEIDAEKLRKARVILAAKTDTQAVDRALELAIANAEIEKAIEQSFGSLPNFEVR